MPQGPIININGSSADVLLENHLKARTAVYEAFKAVQEITPHGRDFQTSPDGDALYRQARAEHNARLIKLSDIMEELEAIAFDISCQRDERKAKS